MGVVGRNIRRAKEVILGAGNILSEGIERTAGIESEPRYRKGTSPDTGFTSTIVGGIKSDRTINFASRTGRSGGGEQHFTQSLVEEVKPETQLVSEQAEQIAPTLAIQPEPRPSFIQRTFSLGFDDDRTVSERGLFFVTPEEAKRLKKTTVPFFEIESKTFPGIVEEAKFTAGTPQVTSVLPTGKATFEFNVAQIEASKEAFRRFKGTKQEFAQDPESFIGQEGVEVIETGVGKEITLTPEFFESRFEGVQDYGKGKARERYEGLPQFTKHKLFESSIRQGLAQFGVGATEFTGGIFTSLAQQRVKAGDSPLDFKMPKFQPQTYAGEIGRLPAPIGSTEFTAQVLPIVVASGGVVKSFIGTARKGGIKTAILETGSIFTPLKLETQFAVAPVTAKTQVKGVSFKEALTEEQFSRLFVGKGVKEDVGVISFQKLKTIGGKTTGESITFAEQPFIDIRAGGTITDVGTRVLGAKGTSISAPASGGFFTRKVGGGVSKQISKDFEASLGESFITPKVELLFGKRGVSIRDLTTKRFDFVRGGGISRELSEGVSVFGAGQRKSIFDFRTTPIGTRRVTTGRFKVEPTIIGKEFDISALLGIAGRGGVTKSVRVTPRKTTQRGLITTQELVTVQDISSSLGVIGKVKTIQAPVKTTLITKPITTQTTMQSFSPQTTTAQIQKSFQSFTPLVLQTQPQREGQVVSLLPNFVQAQSLAQKSIASQLLGTTQLQKLAQQQKQKFGVVQPQRDLFDFKGFRPSDFGRGFIFPLPFPGFGESPGKVKRPKVKRPFKRTPTFGALQLGLFGKKRKGEVTGLVERLPRMKIAKPSLIGN